MADAVATPVALPMTAPVGDAGALPGDLGEVPVWVDRGFDIQGDEVRVAGRSGAHADLHGAMAAAYRNAVHALLVHMMERLKDAPVYGYLRTHVDPVLAVDAAPDALARVSARYEAQAGASAMPERVQAFPVERDGSVSVTAWYRLPRAEFERVLHRYQAAERALGLTVVTAFPLLAATLTGQGDVLVVEVAPGSAAARAGVVPGDMIVRVGNSYVSSPESYAAAATSAWQSTRARRELALELVSRGQHVVRSLKKR
jgi:hypothetical protein